jgi:hypothetical protein
MVSPGRQAIALRRRRTDLIFVAFFVVNAGVFSYLVNLEQLVVVDPDHFRYPTWPPAPVVDLVHWYGRHYDPLVLARPPFWRMTIWLDAIFFGPFYLLATYAFIRGRDWIRLPALVWSGTVAACVLIILMEERYGRWAAPNFPLVLALNAPWLALPAATIWRMRREHPFTVAAPARPDAATQLAAAVGELTGGGERAGGP